MVFHIGEYIYIHTYIRCKSGRVQRIQKMYSKGYSIGFSTRYCRRYSTGLYRVHSIRYSVLFVTLNKLRFVQGFPRS